MHPISLDTHRSIEEQKGQQRSTTVKIQNDDTGVVLSLDVLVVPNAMLINSLKEGNSVADIKRKIQDLDGTSPDQIVLMRNEKEGLWWVKN